MSLRQHPFLLLEIVAKHPLAQRPPNLSQLGPANVGLVPHATVEDVRASLKSFNQHSEAGPSGLRPLHLKQKPREGPGTGLQRTEERRAGVFIGIVSTQIVIDFLKLHGYLFEKLKLLRVKQSGQVFDGKGGHGAVREMADLWLAANPRSAI